MRFQQVWTDKMVDQAVFLVFGCGYSRGEAAKMMGVTKNSLLGRLYRLRERRSPRVMYHDHPDGDSDRWPSYGLVEDARQKFALPPRLKSPVNCQHPSCFNTRQPGRDFCADHIPMPPRKRANMVEIGAI